MTKNSQPWYMENYKKKFSAKSVQRIIPKVEAALAIEMAARNSKRDTLHFHPSELAKENWCPRSSWYKIKGVEESDTQRLDLRRMNILSEGNNIHDKWQRWMHKAGGLYGNWGCLECNHRWTALAPDECPSCCHADSIVYKEVPIHNDEYRVIGHADGIWEDSDGQAVIEIKSVGLGTLRWEAPALYSGYESGDVSLDELWKRIKRPLTSHRKQVNLYMHFLGVDKAIVLYEWKPSQEVKEFHLSLTPDLIQPILDGVAATLPYLEGDEAPPRPGGAAYKQCDFCRFCSYKATCWEK